MSRSHKLAPDVLQQKAARPIRVLGLTRAPAQLPKQRSLLIPGNAGNLNPAQPQRSGHLANPLARPDNTRQQARGDAEDAQQLLIPFALHNVVEQRSRSIGHVRHMLCPARKVPDQPAIHRAKGQFAALRLRTRSGHVVQNPRHLRCREIWVQHQPRAIRNIVPNPARLKLSAACSSPTVLPHNRWMDRLPRRSLPHNHRLALVRDSNRRHVPRPCPSSPQRLHRA